MNTPDSLTRPDALTGPDVDPGGRLDLPLNDRPRPWWRSRLLTAPTMLALAAFVAVAGFALANSSPSSAKEEVIAAATSQATSIDSGRAQVRIDFREPGDVDGTVLLDYRYEGDKVSTFGDWSNLESELSENTEDAEDYEVTDEYPLFHFLRVDGVVYFSAGAEDGDGEYQFDQYLASAEEDEAFDTTTLLVEQNQINASAVAILVEMADTFEQVESDGKTTTYAGSVPSERLQNVPPSELPAGIAMLGKHNPELPESASSLPETVEITVLVENGAIVQSTVEIEGTTPSSPVDATITTTISELGRPQSITAPPADKVVNLQEVSED